MFNENRVAIFVDAENLTQWIKNDGLETLLEELSSIGTVAVRKAYARWTNPSLSAHQGTLNRLGFELIHTFHPISGKNSADIHIAVDVMEYTTRDNLQAIALATGDSDFSPLFRRLREIGKQVIGAGPRSALSESVKSSCSRFFYTDIKSTDQTSDEASIASAFDDAADVLETALKTFDGPANCATLKNRMLNIDSAFDERSLGFKNFTDFVRAIDGIELSQEDKVWSAFFAESSNTDTTTSVPKVVNTPTDEVEQYRTILRQKHWRSIPSDLLSSCYEKLKSIGPLPRSEIPETLVMTSDGSLTTTDVKKATELLTKAGLMRNSGTNEDGETLWEIISKSQYEMLWAVDRAMTARLLTGLKEIGADLNQAPLKQFLLSDNGKQKTDHLIAEAIKISRDPKND